MSGRAGRIGALIATLLLAHSATAWAGASQALLSIGAVVPARCAVRMPGAVEPSAVTAGLVREAVSMRCTRGTLPAGGPAGTRAVGPRISRDLVTTATPSAPRPLAESTRSGASAGTPRVVITVNF
ncbi:MAG TPA: hypothetical protein VIA61_12770 [Methylomirabilota bacterium]|jgi:hypothetical protein